MITRPFSKKLLAIILLPILLVVALVGFKLAQGDSSNNFEQPAKRTETFEEAKTGLKLAYPAELRKSELTVEDTKARILLRLVEVPDQKPLLITVRSETGLRVATTLSKQELLPLLMNNTEKALPQRFKGFAKISSRTFELSGVRAGEVIFTYSSPQGGVVKQRLIIYPKGDDMAIYVAMQAKEADYEQVNREAFEPIVGSLKF